MTCKLAVNRALARMAAARLGLLWPPEQIAGWLKQAYPNDERFEVMLETIHRSLFIQSRGALEKESPAHWRRTRIIRRPRHRIQKSDHHGRILDSASIRDRPATADDPAVPGRCESDLPFGSENSQIAALVERQIRYVTRVMVAGEDSQTVTDARIMHARRLPEEPYQSLTWDRGKETGDQKRATTATDIQMYFCDPHRPWQRGSYENANGLLKRYFSKGIDLSRCSQKKLNTIARQLNERPRKNAESPVASNNGIYG